jgi:hypothetical protein
MANDKPARAKSTLFMDICIALARLECKDSSIGNRAQNKK